MPFLNVAISAAVLAAGCGDGSGGAGGPSPSRLLFASAALQATHRSNDPSACVYEIPKVGYHALIKS